VNACEADDATGANFDLPGPQAEAIVFGNIVLRPGRKLRWDSAAPRITNVPGRMRCCDGR
jgi:hypothetical protein